MRRIAALAVVVSLGLTSCSGGGAPRPRGTRSRPPKATLYAQNLVLFPGPEPAVRLGFEPFEGSARAIVSFQPPTARVSLCPLTAWDAALPPRTRCRRDVGSGVGEGVASSGMRALGIVVDAPTLVEADIVLEFDEAGRSLTLGLPRVSAPRGRSCDDNACNPFFELRPVRAGRFDARVRWEGGEATLVLLQGSVIARAQTATGIPYLEPARATGRSPLSIKARMSAPAEYALALRHAGALRDVVIEARWP